MSMVIPDAVQGGTHTPRSFTWTRGDGSAQDLTGATLSGTKKNIRTGEVTDLADGSLTIVSAAAGTFTWTLDPADVAEAGAYDVQFLATYAADNVEVSMIGRWLVYPQN
jgi:hypothetical protein